MESSGRGERRRVCFQQCMWSSQSNLFCSQWLVFKNEKQEFGKSRFKMHWVIATWLITSLLGLGMGHNTLFEGRKNLLMLSKYVSFQFQNCVRCFPKISNRNKNEIYLKWMWIKVEVLMRKFIVKSLTFDFILWYLSKPEQLFHLCTS